MKRAQVTMTVTVTFDPDRTDPESLASALDQLLDTSLSTVGVLDEYGQVDIGSFEAGAEVKIVSDDE